MFIWILLVALIITAISIILGIVFGYTRNRNYRKGMFTGIIICTVLVAFTIVLGGVYHNEIDALKEQYENIMLYHDVVEISENEQVRFGHYEKVVAFNAEYDRLAKINEDYFFGTIFPDDWSDDMGPIEFYLRGIGYTEQG